MTQFCEIGNTARVTFPDGSVQEFSDTPVSISCVDVPVNLSSPVRCWGWRGTTANNSKWAFFSCAKVASWQVSSPGFSQPYRDGGRVLLTSFFTGTTEIAFIPNDAARILFATGYTQISGNCATSCMNENLNKIITVTGNTGASLFEGEFATCNYSVECSSGCPPGTLDCGDCCLNCNDIFNSISSLRAAVASLS